MVPLPITAQPHLASVVPGPVVAGAAPGPGLYEGGGVPGPGQRAVHPVVPAPGARVVPGLVTVAGTVSAEASG